MSVGLKRKMDATDPAAALPSTNIKRKLEDDEPATPVQKPLASSAAADASASSYPIEFSPPRVEEESDIPAHAAAASTPSCSLASSCNNGDSPSPLRGDCLPSSDDDVLTKDDPAAANASGLQIKRKSEDEGAAVSKRLCTLKELVEDQRGPDASQPQLTAAAPAQDSSPLPLPASTNAAVSSTTAKDIMPLTSVCNKNVPLSPTCPASEDENKENLVCLKSIAENQNFDSILAKTLLAARAADTATKTAAADIGGPKVVVEPLPSIYELKMGRLDDDEDDEEEDEEDEEDSSMFETPPKSPFDRFWTTSGMSSTTTTVSPPLPPGGGAVTAATSTYQFLEDNNQRIECDENGKSYLQLGTVNHHHLPVTPVIQPKPTTLVPRRPIPSCRPSGMPPRPPNPTPPPACGEMTGAGGLLHPAAAAQSCYRQQRTEMLSLSLHKLHMARQRSDSSLRRSVLICNMLRYIEEESNSEARQHEASTAHYHHDHTHHQHHHQQQHLHSGGGGGQELQQSYWGTNSFNAPPTPNPYTTTSNSQQHRDTSGGNSFVPDNGGVGGGFDAPLKDFNSAFRQSSPAASPAASSVADSSSSDSDSEERGINWSSVLSLTSQNELDPLNNNTFAEPTGIWCGSGGGHAAVASDVLSDVDLSQANFDDVSWKLSPISADEVMKAFPEENMFECAA